MQVFLLNKVLDFCEQ